MKKIAIIYPIDIENKKSGGIETCIRDFIKYTPNSWDIKVVGITSDKNMPIGQWRELIFQGRKVYFFPVLLEIDPNKRVFNPLVLRFDFALLKYRKDLDLAEYDLHFHRIEPFFVLDSYGIKKCLFIHGDIRDLGNRNSKNKWKKLTILYFFLESFYIRKMSNIFVVSQDGCNFYKKRYPDIADRFRFLPTWFDANVFKVIPNIKRTDVLKSLEISCQGPVFISVCRLETQKDPILLLNSFKIIRSKFSESCLLIVGDGALKSTMIKMIEKNGLKESVHLLGNKQRNDIAKFLNISDVFLLTSSYEGMPVVVLESISCGTAVVVTNAGASHLVVCEDVNGSIVYIRNPDDIAKAAIHVIERKFDRIAVSSSIQNYRYDKVLGNLFALIQDENVN